MANVNTTANKIIYGGRVLIDLTGDTVEASKLLKDYTAHDRSGAIITGTCEFDANTSDATAAASEILTGKSAYVAGSKVTGSMANNGAVDVSISTVDEEYTVPVGYHDGSGKVKIDSTEQAKIIPANIKTGVEILGVTGTCDPASGVSAQAKTVTPTVDGLTVLPDEGTDYLSQVVVDPIPYTEVDNAQGGLTITIGTAAAS